MSVKPLLWVPRYWPVLGGSELHSRRLAHQLANHTEVGVLTHCNHASQSLAEGAAEAHYNKNSDGNTTLYRTGLQGGGRKLLRGLAALHQPLRLSRPLYAHAFRHLFAPQVAAIAQGYDLIHAVYNGLTESAELAADTAQGQNKPFVWTPLVASNQSQGSGWSSRRFRRLYHRADALIALTEHERQWLIDLGVAEEKVHCIPYGPLLSPSSGGERFRQQYGLGSDPVVLFLGRGTEAKGVDLLGGAMATVWQQKPNCRFLFVGPLDEASRHLLKSHQDPRLLSIESISQADKSAALEMADLFALPSRAESLGVAYLEAWHYRTPVVALDLPTLRSVIDNGVDGLLCADNSDAVARAISTLLEQPQRCQEMGQRGATKVAQHYDWNDIGERMSALYQQLVEQHGAQQHRHVALRSG
jgi:glycosyltransferase involved in cell wall biosynthesis